jgi:hypothetical protein
MDTIFLNLLERLTGISELRYIGEDWGQLSLDQPPVNFPCALLDLAEVNYTQGGRGTQQAEAILNVTLADIRYDGVNPYHPAAVNEKAFGIFRIMDKINGALHGTGSEKHSPLMRVRVGKTLREDSIREFLITYKFAFTDESAMPVYTQLKVPADITLTR